MLTKKIITIITLSLCVFSIGSASLASTKHETISFGANHATGWSDASYQMKVNSPHGFYSKLTGINYVGMPSGLMPAGAEVNFRLYTSRTTGAYVSYATTHTYSDYSNGSWEHAGYTSTPSYNDSLIMASNSTKTNLAGTANVDWYYY